MNNRKIFWKLWCLHIKEIRRGSCLWPFSNFEIIKKLSRNELDSIELRHLNEIKMKDNLLKWKDKNLYLGTKREKEDKERPTPIPGLGSTDETKLMYLKPEHVLCMDQSSNMIQRENAPDTLCDYEVYTYTGEPTSKITYVSLMTTLKQLSNRKIRN